MVAERERALPTVLPSLTGLGRAEQAAACRVFLEAEQAVLAAVQGGLNALIVNPTVPIGPGDHNFTPPSAMISMFLKGQSPAYLDCVLNLVDVRDVATGMVLAAESGCAGERYILGGDNVTLRDLLRLLEQISGRPMPKRTVPGWLALVACVVVTAGLRGLALWRD